MAAWPTTILGAGRLAAVATPKVPGGRRTGVPAGRRRRPGGTPAKQAGPQRRHSLLGQQCHRPQATPRRHTPVEWANVLPAEESNEWARDRRPGNIRSNGEERERNNLEPKMAMKEEPGKHSALQADVGSHGNVTLTCQAECEADFGSGSLWLGFLGGHGSLSFQAGTAASCCPKWAARP